MNCLNGVFVLKPNKNIELALMRGLVMKKKSARLSLLRTDHPTIRRLRPPKRCPHQANHRPHARRQLVRKTEN